MRALLHVAAFAYMVSPTVALAQRLEPNGFVQSDDTRPVARVATGRPSRVPYVLGGAVVGGVLSGVLVYRELKHSEAILGEVTGALITIGGAGVGAFLGWAVYEIRHQHRSTDPQSPTLRSGGLKTSVRSLRWK